MSCHGDFDMFGHVWMVSSFLPILCYLLMFHQVSVFDASKIYFCRPMDTKTSLQYVQDPSYIFPDPNQTRKKLSGHNQEKPKK